MSVFKKKKCSNFLFSICPIVDYFKKVKLDVICVNVFREKCVRMLSSSGTPFSVRDILSEDQQLGIMDCYPSVHHHQHQLQQQHVPQEYYGYNTIVQENNWENVEKFKEQGSMPAYPHYPDLGHVHQLNSIAPPYQDPPVTEDGA